MGLFQVILILIVVLLLVGGALVLGNWVARLCHMDPAIIKVMNVAVIVLVVVVIILWIANLFGILPLHDIPIRSIR